jgi:hypothetical protein
LRTKQARGELGETARASCPAFNRIKRLESFARFRSFADKKMLATEIQESSTCGQRLSGSGKFNFHGFRISPVA